MKLPSGILLLLLLIFVKTGSSQSACHFQLEWQTRYPGFVSPLTLEPDVTGKPFLYVASNEYGLKIYHLDGTLAATLDTNVLSMRVMSFKQYGTLLYVVIGSHWSTDAPGLVIVDVSNPLSPVVKDTWIHPPAANTSGAGIVRVEGSYAYLGAMQLGLIILDISDPTNITYVSELALNNSYPFAGPPAIDPKKYNLRGMEVRNRIVYGCYDAGGVRIINCTNVNAPVQTGRYANPITYASGNQPRAYNNIILDDTIAYVTADYCGLEVLDVSDTSGITLMDNFNPHNAPTGYWWTSPIHANEMEYLPGCKKLFMSTGKSEMIAMDVSNPHAIDSCGGYGSLTDTTGTWGIGMRNDSIFLSYVYNIFCFAPVCPFQAEWNGIKMLKWTDPCGLLSVQETGKNISSLRIQPNPFGTNADIFFNAGNETRVRISIRDLLGRNVFVEAYDCKPGENKFNWNGKDMNGMEVEAGIYFFNVYDGINSETVKLLKSR